MLSSFGCASGAGAAGCQSPDDSVRSAEALQGKEGADTYGRGQNPYGFCAWVGGTLYGVSDEYGFQAVDEKVHIHDLHATMLHVLGIDHTKLTYRYSGRDFRLTDVDGRVVKEILA